MFTIIWNKLVRYNTPRDYITLFHMQWMLTLLKPLRWLYIEFLAYRDALIYENSHNSQVIYLRKLLNDKFDDALRRIYIDNVSEESRVFLYNKVELKPPQYLYNKWNSAVAYLTGQFASDGLFVYKAKTNTTGNKPSISPTQWEFHGQVMTFKNKSEVIEYDFIVYVPTGLSFDPLLMRALINKYLVAGKRYTIKTFV